MRTTRNYPAALISQTLVYATLLLALFALGASAQSDNPPQGGDPNMQAPPSAGQHHGHGPPPEALAACEGKAAGDACTFTGRQNETMSGTCFARKAPPSDTGNQSTAQLACRPARGARNNGQGGPGGQNGPQ